MEREVTEKSMRARSCCFYVKDGRGTMSGVISTAIKGINNKNGNLIMLLSEDLLLGKSGLPIELRGRYERVKTNELRDKISNCYSSECDKGDGKLGEDLISLVLDRGGPVI